MTFRGRIKNGVVVLDGHPSLAEGTVVNVRPVGKSKKPKPGTAEAIMQHAGIWASVADDVEEQLRLLRDMKNEELRRQLEDERLLSPGH